MGRHPTGVTRTRIQVIRVNFREMLIKGKEIQIKPARNQSYLNSSSRAVLQLYSCIFPVHFMITPPRTKVKSENSAISFYITRSQKLILIAPPNQIFPQLTSQTIRGMGMESHSSRIVFPIEKYFPWPKHGIQRSRSLSITCCLLMRIPLAVENFFYRSRNFCRSNIFHLREFFIDGEFLHRSRI